MRRYEFEDMAVGMKESFQVTVTGAMMDSFREMTGDVNPLHCDEEYARGRGYEGKVAYGMLTASFLSTLAGVYLPGEKSLIHSVEFKCLKPVMAGDKLTVTGTVTETDERFGLIRVKAVITNQRNEKVLRGAMQIGVR